MTPTFVSPQVLSDEYLITALIPRPGLKPIVVNAVAGMYGWATSWRDTRGRLRAVVRGYTRWRRGRGPADCHLAFQCEHVMSEDGSESRGCPVSFAALPMAIVRAVAVWLATRSMTKEAAK